MRNFWRIVKKNLGDFSSIFLKFHPFFHITLWIIAFVGLNSCGYRFGQGKLPSKYHTVEVPYICGDKTGEFTSSLIKELSRSGAFVYHHDCADLILQVTIINYHEDNIGYQYDVKDDDDDDDNDGENDNDGDDGSGDDDDDGSGGVEPINKHSIIPTETRIRVLAEVVVVESCSGCQVLGPARITASVDFDHDYYYSPKEINQFSLGQLTDAEAARSAVMHPLSKVLAEKIVDYVVHSW